MKGSFFLVFVTALLLTAACNDPSILRGIEVREPALSAMPDGVYEGAYTLPSRPGVFIGNPEAEVRVVVSNHRYQTMTVTGKLKPNMQGFLDTMVREQKINLDGISGATWTKRVLQKAVEDALSRPPVKQ